MSGSKEQAIAGVTSGTLTLGDTVTWRALALWYRVPDDL